MSLQNSRKALTLVEVLAVVVIISLLAVTLVVGVTANVGTAKHKLALTQITRLKGSVESYQTLKGQMPDELSVLVDPGAAYGIDQALLKDPWGRPYELLVPGPDGHPFEITSLGADGQAGGSDENADLSSAQLGVVAE